MIGFNLGGTEGIVVLVVVLVLFGGSQIPKLARNLGRAQREFKDGIDEAQRESPSSAPPASPGSASTVTDTTASTDNADAPK